MTRDLLLGFVGFALATSLTPGPNNTMLLASGANFGLRRTLPHVAGIAVGLVVMLMAVALGAGQVLAALPGLRRAMTVAGALYLLWLAAMIARAGPPGAEAPARGRPLGPFQAAAFQWINPKAWMMVLGAAGAYAPAAGDAGSVVTLAAVGGLVTLGSTLVWAAFGSALRPVLAVPDRARWFNRAMASLLILSLLPALLEEAGALVP